jgi:uncharacterized repeat protein (TIGR01451 family)
LIVLGAAQLDGQTLRNRDSQSRHRHVSGVHRRRVRARVRLRVRAGRLGVGITITLNESVDRVNGTLADVLTYTIAYQAIGTATATNVVIGDFVGSARCTSPAASRSMARR